MLRSLYSFFIKSIIAFVILALLTGCNVPVAGNNGGSQSVQIVSPQEGAQFDIGDLVSVKSNFSDPGGAQGMILEVNGVATRDDKFYSPMFQGNMDQPWRSIQNGPAAFCVYLSTSDGKQIRSNCVTVMIGSLSVPAIIPSITFTPVPELTFTPTFTATPGAPTVTATQDANCRLGPGTAYGVTSSLLTGQTAPITGRNTDSSWWVIQITGSGDCWIWGQVVTVTGDTNQVPVITPPPLPTAPLSAPSLISPNGTLNCAATTGGVTLSWSAVSHSNGISNYEWVLEGGVDNSGSTSSTQAVISSISCGASYQWRVRDVDGQGNIGPWSEYMQFNIP